LQLLIGGVAHMLQSIFIGKGKQVIKEVVMPESIRSGATAFAAMKEPLLMIERAPAQRKVGVRWTI
jgi:hypothetical protein